MKRKIKSREELERLIAEQRERGKRIVATSGCFDIIHSGHVQYLEQAKEKGDLLVVFLNSDRSVNQLKGSGRPVVGEKERAIVLAALESVDYICIFDEETPCNLIEYIQPDIFVKGGDYSQKHIPEMDSVKQYGGRVEYLLMVPECSTTGIIAKIFTLQKEQD